MNINEIPTCSIILLPASGILGKIIGIFESINRRLRKLPALPVNFSHAIFVCKNPTGVMETFQDGEKDGLSDICIFNETLQQTWNEDNPFYVVTLKKPVTDEQNAIVYNKATALLGQKYSIPDLLLMIGYELSASTLPAPNAGGYVCSTFSAYLWSCLKLPIANVYGVSPDDICDFTFVNPVEPVNA